LHLCSYGFPSGFITGRQRRHHGATADDGLINRRAGLLRIRAAKHFFNNRNQCVQSFVGCFALLGEFGNLPVVFGNLPVVVSNLLVVLCGEGEVTPIVNAGTLYT